MRKSVLWAAGALLAATAGVGSATDFATPLITTAPPPPPAPVQDWLGPYMGVVAGYGLGNFSAPISATANGIVVTGFAGFNALQIDRFLIGVESDASWSRRTDGSAPSPNALGWTATLRARAGVAFDRLLIYATGGVAVGGVTTDVPTFSTEVGWIVGAGAEFKLGENRALRAEFLRANYGPVGGGGGSALTTSEFRAGMSFHY